MHPLAHLRLQTMAANNEWFLNVTIEHRLRWEGTPRCRRRRHHWKPSTSCAATRSAICASNWKRLAPQPSNASPCESATTHWPTPSRAFRLNSNWKSTRKGKKIMSNASSRGIVDSSAFGWQAAPVRNQRADVPLQGRSGQRSSVVDGKGGAAVQIIASMPIDTQR